ncbi:MAG: hypothetical protein Q9212_005764 [Teloschistes hypoglaucus]
MSRIPAEQSFTNTLEKLELLAEIQARLTHGDRNRHEDLINKEIGTLLEVSKDDWTSKNRLELHHRLITVRAGLDESETKSYRKNLDIVITRVVTDEEPLSQALDEELILPTSSLKSWSVPIMSCISKPDHWHQRDYKGDLEFRFDVDSGNFEITEDQNHIEWAREFDTDIETRFIAIAVVGKYNHIRLVPVHLDRKSHCEVCDIKLQKAEHAQTMIDFLLDMGYTVIGRPAKSVNILHINTRT